MLYKRLKDRPPPERYYSSYQSGSWGNSAVVEPYVASVADGFDDEPQQEGAINEADRKKEIIQQAMSELRKRSAVAKAKKAKR